MLRELLYMSAVVVVVVERSDEGFRVLGLEV